MSRIQWDCTGMRLFETGVDRCVLYPKDVNTDLYQTGVPWNGVTAITETDNGYSLSPLYANNKKYIVQISESDPQVSLEAYTYPEEFIPCDGYSVITDGVVVNRQKKTPFGLSYRSLVGNDLLSTEYGYKIHLLWGLLSFPTDKAYSTVNDSPEATQFSWNMSSTPIEFPGYKPITSMEIDSRFIMPNKMAKLEALLYGGDFTQPELPTPAEVYALLRLNPLVIHPMASDEELGDITVSALQSNVECWTHNITGIVKANSWLWDPFSFEHGLTTGDHYYLALDFSDNDFNDLTECYCYVNEDVPYNIFGREDHKVLVEIDELHTTLTIVQVAMREVFTYTLDLSNLVFSSL